MGVEGEPNCHGGGASGGGVGGEGEPTPQTALISWVDAESEPTRGGGDSGGDATAPSSCCRQSLLGGDISVLFLLALVTRGEMTGHVRVVGVLAASRLPGVTQTAAEMGAGDAGAAGSAAEAFPASATVAAVASVAARLRSRHLFLRGSPSVVGSAGTASSLSYQAVLTASCRATLATGYRRI